MHPDLIQFLKSELEAWPMADENFARIRNAVAEDRRLTLTAAGSPWRIDKMFVNHRRASITAKTDAGSISQRPCFLCAVNRPTFQSSLPLGTDYEILINPFPLAELHFTIPSLHHEPQTLGTNGRRIMDMANLAKKMAGLCVFYNGATCGASAPDHLHFQAVSVDAVPNITDERIIGSELLIISDATIYAANATAVPYPFFIIESSDNSSLGEAFTHLWEALIHAMPDEEEPAVNIAMLHNPGSDVTRTVIIPRRRHRPQCYFAEKDRLLISPATIEMLGTIICSRREDFYHLNLETAIAILQEVGLAPDTFEKAVEILTSNATKRS